MIATRARPDDRRRKIEARTQLSLRKYTCNDRLDNDRGRDKLFIISLDVFIQSLLSQSINDLNSSTFYYDRYRP